MKAFRPLHLPIAGQCHLYAVWLDFQCALAESSHDQKDAMSGLLPI